MKDNKPVIQRNDGSNRGITFIVVLIVALAITYLFEKDFPTDLSFFNLDKIEGIMKSASVKEMENKNLEEKTFQDVEEEILNVATSDEPRDIVVLDALAEMPLYWKEKFVKEIQLLGLERDWHFIISATITEDGSLTDVELSNDPYEIKDEVLRVIETLPKWQPALKEGKSVSSLEFIEIYIPVTNESIGSEKETFISNIFNKKNVKTILFFGAIVLFFLSSNRSKTNKDSFDE